MKEIRPTLTSDDQDRADRGPRTLLDSLGRRAIRRSMEARRVALIQQLRRAMNDVQEGRPVDRILDRVRERMMTAFAAAYTDGLKVAGYPDWEVTREQATEVVDLVTDELRYFERFMRGLAEEAMDPDRRVELYGGAADDALWRGWLSVLPTESVIHWRLSVAEHCPDCLRLAAGSPYTKPGGTNPLPTVPRNGDTRCLGNCRCWLEEGPPASTTIAPAIGIEVTAEGGVEIDPTSPRAVAAAAAYTELVATYAWHVRMAEASTEASDIARHMTTARSLKRTITELAESRGHRVRMASTQAEMLEPIVIAKRFGLNFVNPVELDDDLVLAVAVVISLDSVDKGTITQVNEQPPLVTLDDDPGRTYRLDPQGRSILYTENQP